MSRGFFVAGGFVFHIWSSPLQEVEGTNRGIFESYADLEVLC